MEIHASLRAEEILRLGPVGITNSMMMAWAAMLVLAVFAYFAGRNPQLVPRGAQNVFEFILESLLTTTVNTAGRYARTAFPLIATLFLFIITANYMGMMPGVGTIHVANPNYHGESTTTHAAVRANVAEASPSQAETPGQTSSGTSSASERHELPTVPLLRAANADVNMTFGMGMVAFLFIHGSGIAVHRLSGYWKELSTPPVLTPVKLVIEMFVPVSLSMRLFGNIFGGEMLLAVMAFPIIAVPFMILELLFGFIQALIFTLLTLIFTSLAVYVPPGHEGGHGEAHEGAHPQPAGASSEPSVVPAHA